MRPLLVCAVTLWAAACTTDRCKDKTVFVAYALTNGAEAADAIDVTLTVGSDAPQTRTVARKSAGASGSIEVAFTSYPTGKSLSFTLSARAGAGILATASQTITASAGCSVLSFTLDGGAADLADTSGQTDLAGADLTVDPTADLSTPPDMAILQFSSCIGLPATCGPGGNGNCCASPIVTGGTFYRLNDAATADSSYKDTTHPATISSFRLDRYEITVGRFRNFVGAGLGTQANPPALGAGAQPNIPDSGWALSYNGSLAANTTALITAIKCNTTYQTWQDTAGANENRPMNCITWFEAAAFCAWDGGFLPTEAQYHYAASGGSEQRAFPWSSPAGSVTIDTTYAVYNCGAGGPGTCTGITNVGFVGSVSPKGDGKYGQADLSGNVWEWMLDYYKTPYPTPCVDCTDLTSVPNRVTRGGGYGFGEPNLRSSFRNANNPAQRDDGFGARCARRM
ncbi:MAG: hypothetical protein JWN44_852 [Myxococcales bacterium]|nr:hypothetical protein [Myxococcales bacterium]